MNLPATVKRGIRKRQHRLVFHDPPQIFAELFHRNVATLRVPLQPFRRMVSRSPANCLEQAEGLLAGHSNYLIGSDQREWCTDETRSAKVEDLQYE